MNTIKSKLTAILMASIMVFTVAPLMGAQKAYAVPINDTVSFTLKTNTVQFDDAEAAAVYEFLKVAAERGVINVTPYETSWDFRSMYYDLNRSGKNDICFTANLRDGKVVRVRIWRDRDTCDMTGAWGLECSDELLASYAAMPDDNDLGLEYYYRTMMIDFPTIEYLQPRDAVVDLSKGPQTFSGAQSAALELFLDDISGVSVNCEEVEYDNTHEVLQYDLDKNGTYDILQTVQYVDSISDCYSTIERLEGCSVKNQITLSLRDEDCEDWDSRVASEEQTYYYKTVTFKMKELKANTLTLKGKTVKIKAKKLKKKAKTYGISKFMTVSRAQGAVTYAKVSGNKKIKIASNGKVTLKKKLKKGKYIVKVNVTAAGNDDYTKVTKAAVFTVKVK